MSSERFMRHHYGANGFVERDKMKEPIEIFGVWIRSIGGKVELLVETADGWKLCATETLDSNFGHIVEPLGIKSAPFDYLRDRA
jgi:hypothetical protein